MILSVSPVMVRAMTDAIKSKRRWFQFRPRTVLALVLTCAIPCSWLAVKMQEEPGQPQILAAMNLEGDHFYGAAANSDTFFILVDDTLHAFSSSGVHLWQRDAPWYKHPDSDSCCEVLAPNFNRPAPVVMRNAVVVLTCKNWVLSLNAYDFKGNLLATVKPVAHNMELQGGILHLSKAANLLAFGYRLESKTNHDNPDKGLIVFDENLHKLREYDVWGDHLCCSDDGSMYVRTVRWGKDTKWVRITSDGQTTPLPTNISCCTSVVQPGIGSEMILWGGKDVKGEQSNSNGVRQVWKALMPEATTIIEYKKDWLGEMIACPDSRYMVRVWPNHKQKFLCLGSDGRVIWEHDLTLSCYFWPPKLLCGPDGKVYLMDTVPGFHPWVSDIVLRCLTSSGETAWELTVDQTKQQPVFDSYLSPSGSHVLLIRCFNAVVKSARQKITLTFVSTENNDTK